MKKKSRTFVAILRYNQKSCTFVAILYQKDELFQKYPALVRVDEKEGDQSKEKRSVKEWERY